MGCGTIAMCDAELYLTLQNSGYSLRVPTTFATDFQQTGLCQKDAYRDYIEQMYKSRYPITDVNAGLYPWNMEKELHVFLFANHSSNTWVKWARYGKIAGVERQQKILDEIEGMLNKDIPVVFSYYSFTKGDKIILYDSLQAAENGNKVKEDGTEQTGTNSHYMTITGLYRCPGEQPWNYKYILEVVSWGQVYYIDYDAYAQKLDYVSNILSVH